MSRAMSPCMPSIQDDVWSPTDSKNRKKASPKPVKSLICKQNQWFSIDFLVRTLLQESLMDDTLTGESHGAPGTPKSLGKQ